MLQRPELYGDVTRSHICVPKEIKTKTDNEGSELRVVKMRIVF